LTSLSRQNVPTYVFSSGYGDVVTQAMLYGGLNAAATSPAGDLQGQGQMSGSSSHLPHNVRVVSNFFRTDPAGMVRAFSRPIVHERNKNCSTAAAFMGMPVPERRHAITVGAHEDDAVAMAHLEGGEDGIREHIAIGYLELADDLAERLPTYLTAFDAVVVGDGSFEFVRELIDDILEVSSTNSEGPVAQGQENKLGGLLKKGFGSLFSTGNHDEPPQQQQQYQQHFRPPLPGVGPPQGQAQAQAQAQGEMYGEFRPGAGGYVPPPPGPPGRP